MAFRKEPEPMKLTIDDSELDRVMEKVKALTEAFERLDATVQKQVSKLEAATRNLNAAAVRAEEASKMRPGRRW